MYSFGKGFAFGGKLNALAQIKQTVLHTQIKAVLPHSPWQQTHAGWGKDSKDSQDDDCDKDGRGKDRDDDRDDDRGDDRGGHHGGLKSLLGSKLTKLAGWGQNGFGGGKDDDDCDDGRDGQGGGHNGGNHGGHHGGHNSGHHGHHGAHHGGKDDDCDPKDDDGDSTGGGTPGGGTSVAIPADTTGITFHVDEDDDGSVNAYLYIKAEDGVDPATVSFDDYLQQLKDEMAETHPDLDPSKAVIKATIYSETEGESYYYFNGTEFEELEDAEYYEEFACNFGTIPDEEPAEDDEDKDEPVDHDL